MLQIDLIEGLAGRWCSAGHEPNPSAVRDGRCEAKSFVTNRRHVERAHEIADGEIKAVQPQGLVHARTGHHSNDQQACPVSE